MITDLPTKRIKALSRWKTFLGVLRTKLRQKPTGIDMEQNYVTATLSIMETATLLRASSAGWFGCSTTTTSFEGSYTYYATEEIDIDVCNRTTSGYTQHGERRFFGFNGQTQTYVVRCCAALAITLLAPQRATYVWTSTYSRKWHADGMKFLLFDLWRTCKFFAEIWCSCQCHMSR